MKMRGIIIVDYEISSGSMNEVSIELQRMQDAMSQIIRASKNAIDGTCDIKERRKGGLPDLSKVKFRTS